MHDPTASADTSLNVAVPEGHEQEGVRNLPDPPADHPDGSASADTPLPATPLAGPHMAEVVGRPTPEVVEPAATQDVTDHVRRGAGSDWLLPVTGLGMMLISAYALVVLMRNRSLES